MRIDVYCDASFYSETKIAGLAIIIRDENQRCLLKTCKKITCYDTTAAELRAVNKAVGYLLDRQMKNLLPLDCTITIRSDSMGVIKRINNGQNIRNVDKGIMAGLYRNIKFLRTSNKVKFYWISRKHNKEADKKSKDIKDKLDA